MSSAPAGYLRRYTRDYKRRLAQSAKPQYIENYPEKLQEIARLYNTGFQDMGLLVHQDFYQSEEELNEFLGAERRMVVDSQPLEVGGRVVGNTVVTIPKGDNATESANLLKNYKAYSELKERGWELQSVNEASRSRTFVHEGDGQAYIAFDQFDGDPTKGAARFLGSTEDSSESLVFRDIVRNDQAAIDNNSQFGAEARAEIESEVSRLRGAGMDVEFTGWSRGGYAATYWGSRMDMPTNTINAHIMPANEFPPTEAEIVHHTIVNDPTNFKYGLQPSDQNEAFLSHEHRVYPPAEGNAGLDSHMAKSFLGTPDVEAGMAHYEKLPVVSGKPNAIIGERVIPLEAGATAAEAGLTALGFVDAGFDAAEGNYAQAADEGGMAAAFLANPAIGNEWLAADTWMQAQHDIDEGNRWTGIRREAEATIEGVAPALGPMGILVGDAGVASIEEGIQAKALKDQGDKVGMGLAAAQSALVGAAAISAPFTEGAGAVLFGGAAGVVHLVERARNHRRLKEQMRNSSAAASRPGYQPIGASARGKGSRLYDYVATTGGYRQKVSIDGPFAAN